MRLILVIALLLGLAACASDVAFEQERDGGIGGTGVAAASQPLL